MRLGWRGRGEPAPEPETRSLGAPPLEPSVILSDDAPPPAPRPPEPWLLGPQPTPPLSAHLPAAVSCTGLGKRYGSGDAAVDALREVSVSFAPGTFTAVMGPSGSGKSTLMHLLAGLDTPTSGMVELAGIPLDGLDDDGLTELRRAHVGFVFQAYNLLPMLNAEENVLLPLRLAGLRADRVWVDAVFDACGLADRRSHRPSELSGGQQQRLAIARALITQPSIVFADEPTGNVDSAAGAEVLSLLGRAVDQFGQTVVLVTHDAAAASRTERVVFLRDGTLAGELRRPTADAVADALLVR